MVWCVPLQANEFMDYSLLVGIRKCSARSRVFTYDIDVKNLSDVSSLKDFSSGNYSDTDSDNEFEEDKAWSAFDKIRDITKTLAKTEQRPRSVTCSDDCDDQWNEKTELSPFLDRTGFPSTDPSGHIVGDEVYMLGVIDILEHYTLRKKIEHKLKSLRQRTWDSDTVSATDVVTYAHRFLDFIGSIVK
jgi:hypothetical protein